MLIELLDKYFLNQYTFHRFTYFLGTQSGELLRRFTELVFYAIIIYMIISEFRKNEKREYKYLIVGFFALFLRQMLMSTILFTRVFGIDKFTRFEVLIGFIDGYLETTALLLLVSAFMFPAFKEKTAFFQKSIISFFYVITFAAILNYLFYWFVSLEPLYAYIVLDLIKIVVLIAPFFLVTKQNYRRIGHIRAVLLAFFIYLLIPLTSFISLLISGRIDPRLAVIQHPLPFLSILLLIRTVYLTLVDKAFLDIKLKRSEEVIRHEKELNKLKDHFISIVSHELRTPITSMKLYLSLLWKGKFGSISQKQSSAIKTLENENSRLSDLIDNLLTINKIEANKLVIDKTDFELHEIIDEMYIHFAREKGISVVNRIRKGFKVNGDKRMLKQVYINLMNNAIKFSDRNGKIALSCGRKRNEWFLSVKDYGIGISREEIPKLFNKFYQADNALTRKNQGIGLGLSIVKNIVEMHHGRVEVNSDIGKGAEFRIWMPDGQIKSI